MRLRVHLRLLDGDRPHEYGEARTAVDVLPDPGGDNTWWPGSLRDRVQRAVQDVATSDAWRTAVDAAVSTGRVRS